MEWNTDTDRHTDTDTPGWGKDTKVHPPPAQVAVMATVIPMASAPCVPVVLMSAGDVAAPTRRTRPAFPLGDC
jgi:hypothetical protein